MPDEQNSGKPSSVDPPPVRRDIRKPLTLVACGLIVAALLLVVVTNVRPPGPSDTNAEEPADIIEIVEPGRLTEEELLAEDRPLSAEVPDVPRGGWIQITDEHGRLAQQYGFENLDPHPPGKGPGWLYLVQPEFQFYGSDGSVTVLTGESALAYAPNRAVESGTLTGNVLIRRFEETSSGRADPAADRPAFVLETDEARLDGILGEVRCDGEIHLETTNAEFSGRALQLLINDRDNVIESLRVREVDFIRLAGAPSPVSRGSPSAADALSSSHGRAERDGDEPAATPARSDEPKPADAPRRNREAHPPTDVQYYRLTLRDNVRITQGVGDHQRSASGDSLAVIFTLHGEEIGATLARTPRRPAYVPRETAPPTRRGGRAVALAQFIMSLPFASFSQSGLALAPPPSDEDTRVTCEGGLTMVPLTDHDRPLPPAGEALLELLGDPVQLHDPDAQLEATCAVLQYHTADDRVDLLASKTQPLRIDGPQLHTFGERFWLARAQQTGGLTGRGEMKFLKAPSDTPAPAPSALARQERLSVRWSEHVDLVFDPAPRPGALGPIRTAVFNGDVHVHGDDVALAAATGEAAAGSSPPPDASAGDLHCRQLTVDMKPATDARVTLRRLLALGDVKVADLHQTIWSESFLVEFAPGQGQSPPSSQAPATSPETDIDRIVAETGVQLRLARGRRVFADRMVVNPRDRSAELTGSDVTLVDQNNVIDEAERITADDLARVYVVHGKGRFRRFDGPVLHDSDARIEPAALSSLPDRTEELSITWRDRLDLAPLLDADRTGPAADAPQLATFIGDVQVVSPEMKLTHADQMSACFGPAETDASIGNTLRAIDANGSVHVRAVGRAGEIRCDDLHVDVAPGRDGQLVPTRLTVRGAVRVADEHQRLWADSLTADFRERPGDEPIAETPGADDFAHARVQLDTIHAEGNVQLRSASGQRVFADRLVGDAVNRTAELFGDRVLVVSEQFALDHGRHLLVDELREIYESHGPGVCYAFAEPIPLDEADAPVALPALDGPRTLEASWTESAIYLRHDDSLVLRGAVRGESWPNPLEHNIIEGDALTLDFLDDESSEDDPAPSRLAHLLARGDAKIESRIRLSPDDERPARVYYVAGQHIDYDQETLEATVIGDGELLVYDVRSERSTEDGDAGETFSPRGTTLFRWSKELHMTQIVDDLFTITMTGDVRGKRVELDGRWAKLSGQFFETTVERAANRDETPAVVADGAVDLGGAMKIKRVYGHGGIVVETPDRVVMCDEFDYNVAIGVADLKAARGRTLSIQTGDVVRPLRAEHVLWNMKDDTITVTRGAGGVR